MTCESVPTTQHRDDGHGRQRDQDRADPGGRRIQRLAVVASPPGTTWLTPVDTSTVP